MIAIPRQYQAVFFGHMVDIQPSADTIPVLLEAFRVPGLLPSTFHEIGSAPTPQVRLRLSSPDNEWSIEFGTSRISVEKNGIKPLGANLGTPEDFTKDAIDFLGRILSRFPRKAIRLSLVTNGLLDEMPEEKLRDIYSRLFVPLEFYKKNPTAGWNSRSLARIPVDIDGRKETFNVITHVNRIQGSLPQEDAISRFDRVQIMFDINTYQGNIEPRFDMPLIEIFYSRALEVRNTLVVALKERING